jgi:hypothetical protein
MVRRALEHEAPALLETAPVYTLDRENFELLTREDRLVFSFTASGEPGTSLFSGLKAQ